MLATVIITSIFAGFIVLFTGIWLLVTSLIGATSGWFSLMKRYPDSGEDAFATLRFQTARMGGSARLSNIMTLAACSGGLRLGLPRMFSPFGRDILVPWREIEISASRVLFGETVTLTFGGRREGRLEIYRKVAEQLAAASHGRWPPMPPALAR